MFYLYILIKYYYPACLCIVFRTKLFWLRHPEETPSNVDLCYNASFILLVIK